MNRKFWCFESFVATRGGRTWKNEWQEYNATN